MERQPSDGRRRQRRAPPFDSAGAKKSLANQAYEAIRRRILTCELPPGSMVIAPQLARELGMSQTPVHEALKLLCAEQLARVIPRTGYVISSLSASDVREIFQLRLTLEPLAVELAVRWATEAQLDGFRRTAHPDHAPRERVSRVPTEELRTQRAEIHDSFHIAIATLSGQARLVSIIRDLLQQGRRLLVIDAFRSAARLDRRPSEMQHAHRRIANAVLARDRTAAVEAMTDHVRVAHRAVVEAMASAAQAGVEARDPTLILD